MKRGKRTTSLTKWIVSALLGREGLTPAQRAKLAEMDKDYEQLVQERNGHKDEKTLKQNRTWTVI